MNYRFILEPYKGIATRHTCPECEHKRCFARYIDIQKLIRFPEYVGRCNREHKCGYHFTPKEYFEQNPEREEPRQVYECPTLPPLPTDYIAAGLVQRSMNRYRENRLFQFLSSRLGEGEAMRLMKLYRVGTANYWHGSTVFWQTDVHGKVRTGKIMLYDPTTGRRIKEPHNHITWVHSIIYKQGFNLKQCFFGEHLLPSDTTKSVAIVESEKSALIASSYLPQYLWIASGGKNGCCRDENLCPLKDRNVVLFPDLGAADDWTSRIPSMERIGISVKLFDHLERNATPEQLKNGLDIADFLLEIKPPKVTSPYKIYPNPELQITTEMLGLNAEKEAPFIPELRLKRRLKR